MDEATRPVDVREAREEGMRRAAEQARRVAEEARMAREAAERARAQAEQQRQQEALTKQRTAGALKEANRTAERELHGLMKEHGATQALRDPRTVEQMGRAMERTLKEHHTKMSELGWTRENLREQIGAYTKEIAKDPEAFMQRMEPLKEQTKERSRGIEHDRGHDYGYSR